MAAILPQMGGDLVGATRRRQHGRTHRIGMAATPRIAHGRHMIDIHTQSQMLHLSPHARFISRDTALPSFLGSRLRTISSFIRRAA